jgi:hypothetical protein
MEPVPGHHPGAKTGLDPARAIDRGTNVLRRPVAIDFEERR